MPTDNPAHVGGLKYLFLSNSDSPEGKDLTKKVVNGFMRKAFLTDATLYFASPVKPYSDRPYSLIYQTLRGGSCRFQTIYLNQISMTNLIPQFDYYIAGNNPEEYLYMQTAISSGVPIIGTVETEDEMFADIPIVPQVEALKNSIKPQIVEMFKNFPPAEYQYFLFHSGLGESLGFFYWLKEYRKISKKKIVLFCVSDAHLSLASLSPYVDLTVKMPPVVFDYLYIFCSEDYGIKNFCGFYADSRVVAMRKARSPYGKRGFFENVQTFLGIPARTKFSRYDVELPEKSIATAQKIFNELGLTKGRTVFMVTTGVSQGLNHHKNFWIKIAQRLKEKNFEVVTNSQKQIIPDCKNVFMQLADSSAFAGLCGNVISTTTGFTEVICSVNVRDKIRLHILTHSDNDAKRWDFSAYTHDLRYYGRKLFDNWIDGMFNYLEYIMPSNVEYSFTKFGNTEEEDDAIIERIVAEISES